MQELVKQHAAHQGFAETPAQILLSRVTRALDALIAVAAPYHGLFPSPLNRHGVELEPLYGVELHYRGTILPDFGFESIPRERLAVLTPDEVGAPKFTISGWLRST